jgi:hypothetical protein
MKDGQPYAEAIEAVLKLMAAGLKISTHQINSESFSTPFRTRDMRGKRSIWRMLQRFQQMRRLSSEKEAALKLKRIAGIKHPSARKLLREFKASQSEIRKGFWEDVLFKDGQPNKEAIKAFLELMAKGLAIPVHRINAMSFNKPFKTAGMRARKRISRMLSRFKERQALDSFDEAVRKLKRIAGIQHPSVRRLLREFKGDKSRLYRGFWEDVLFEDNQPNAEAIKAFLKLMAEGLNIPAHKITTESFNTLFKTKDMRRNRRVLVLRRFKKKQGLSSDKEATRELKLIAGIQHPSVQRLLSEFQGDQSRMRVGFWDDVLFKNGQPNKKAIKAFLKLMTAGLGVPIHTLGVLSFRRTFAVAGMKRKRSGHGMLDTFKRKQKLGSFEEAVRELKRLAGIKYPSVQSLLNEFKATKSKMRHGFWDDVLFKDGRPNKEAIKAFLKFMAAGLFTPVYKINVVSFYRPFRIGGMSRKREMSAMLFRFKQRHGLLTFSEAVEVLKSVINIPLEAPEYQWKAAKDLYSDRKRIDTLLVKFNLTAEMNIYAVEQHFRDAPEELRRFYVALMFHYRRGNRAALDYIIAISQPLIWGVFNYRNRMFYNDRLYYIREDALQQMQLAIVQYLGYFNEKASLSLKAYLYTLVIHGFNQIVSLKGLAVTRRDISLFVPVGDERKLLDRFSTESASSPVKGLSNEPVYEASSPMENRNGVHDTAEVFRISFTGKLIIAISIVLSLMLTMLGSPALMDALINYETSNIIIRGLR